MPFPTAHCINHQEHPAPWSTMLAASITGDVLPADGSAISGFSRTPHHRTARHPSFFARVWPNDPFRGGPTE
jgi:hypothetical protein